MFAWRDITDNATVLDWLQNGVKLPFQQIPEKFHLSNSHLSASESQFVSTELQKLGSSGAIFRNFVFLLYILSLKGTRVTD